MGSPFHQRIADDLVGFLVSSCQWTVISLMVHVPVVPLINLHNRFTSLLCDGYQAVYIQIQLYLQSAFQCSTQGVMGICVQPVEDDRLQSVGMQSYASLGDQGPGP